MKNWGFFVALACWCFAVVPINHAALPQGWLLITHLIDGPIAMGALGLLSVVVFGASQFFEKSWYSRALTLTPLLGLAGFHFSVTQVPMMFFLTMIPFATIAIGWVYLGTTPDQKHRG